MQFINKLHVKKYDIWLFLVHCCKPSKRTRVFDYLLNCGGLVFKLKGLHLRIDVPRYFHTTLPFFGNATKNRYPFWVMINKIVTLFG